MTCGKEVETLPKHYKGATGNIKHARYHIRQADRILRNKYHGPTNAEHLYNAHAFLDRAQEHIEREIAEAATKTGLPMEV